MTEAMTPERWQEIVGHVAEVRRSRGRHRKAWTLVDADLPDLYDIVLAEREARQRAERDLAEERGRADANEMLYRSAEGDVSDAIARAERAEAERDECGHCDAAAAALGAEHRQGEGHVESIARLVRERDEYRGAHAEAAKARNEIHALLDEVREVLDPAGQSSRYSSLKLAAAGLIARADTAEAAYSALREEGERFAKIVHGGNPRSVGSLRFASVLTSTPASLAASYRERVERETIDRCANECEAKAADMRGLMHGLWLSSGADECAARLRSLADAEKGGEQT
jgi:hypothetical protein